MAYVTTSPDGQLFGDDGVESDGQTMFRFPMKTYSKASPQTDEWAIDFNGTLRFVAHFGALDVTLTGIRAVISAGHPGYLSVADSKGRREVLAKLPAAKPTSIEDWLVWPPLEATLTEYGSELLGGVYGEGAALDPLRIVISGDSTSLLN